MRPKFRFFPYAALIGALVAAYGSLYWSDTGAQSFNVQKAQSNAFSGDPNRPKRHFRVPNPASLDNPATQRSYSQLVDTMAKGYSLSGDPAARSYRQWRKFNTAPHASATHGRRYVNTYANTTARSYGKFESAGLLPQGSVIAKDSFTVDANGAMAAGPLFLMEKMAAGFNYVSGDWRYTMIMPDGSIFGRTKGENAARVEFCIGCHLAREPFDHLFFVPKAFRAPPQK